jgi:hypothetical protein
VINGVLVCAVALIFAAFARETLTIERKTASGAHG